MCQWIIRAWRLSDKDMERDLREEENRSARQIHRQQIWRLRKVVQNGRE